jgi:cytochrome bd-type quinol oxidase subunit 1
MLSWLSYRDVNAVVKGLDDFPPQDTPPVVTVHVAFQVMVGLGVYLLLSFYAGWIAIRRRRCPTRWFLKLLVLASPLSIVAGSRLGCDGSGASAFRSAWRGANGRHGDAGSWVGCCWPR